MALALDRFLTTLMNRGHLMPTQESLTVDAHALKVCADAFAALGFLGASDGTRVACFHRLAGNRHFTRRVSSRTANARSNAHGLHILATALGSDRRQGPEYIDWLMAPGASEQPVAIRVDSLARLDSPSESERPS